MLFIVGCFAVCCVGFVVGCLVVSDMRYVLFVAC